MDDDGNVETPRHPHTDPELMNWYRWQRILLMMEEVGDDGG